MVTSDERKAAVKRVVDGLVLFKQRTETRNLPVRAYILLQIDAHINDGAKVVDASPAGYVAFEVQVGLEYSNRAGRELVASS
ncbi:MAG: hypothetical protein MMC23_008657 [Stictis urceolatum]|nr:hypothetical protein [Stictis urceolata]